MKRSWQVGKPCLEVLDLPLEAVERAKIGRRKALARPLGLGRVSEATASSLSGEKCGEHGVGRDTLVKDSQLRFV